MTTTSMVTSPWTGERVSPFAGADVCEAARLTVEPGGHRARFDEDVWLFTAVEGLSQQQADWARLLDFTLIRDARWRPVAKEFFFARMAPWHDGVRTLPAAYRTPVHVMTCYQHLGFLADWLNWLTDNRVTSLAQVTQQHCDSYLEWRRHVRGKDGTAIRPRSEGGLADTAQAVIELAYYTQLFTTDAYSDGFLPWQGRSAHSIAGKVVTRKNKTPVLDDTVLQPLLAAALYVCQTLGPHLLAQPPRSLARHVSVTSSGENWQARITDVLHRHQRSGTPLELLPDFRIQKRLKLGWLADDSLLAVNLNAVAQEAGIRTFREQWLGPLRGQLEQTLADVGVQAGWGVDAALVPRADGQGEVPWTLPLTRAQDIDFLIEKARTACILVIAGVTGMRTSEVMELPLDCALTPSDAGAGRVRYRLAGKLIKGQPLGGKREEWVTVKEPHDAAILAAGLLGEDSGKVHLFGRIGFKSRYQRFREWVNGPEGRRLGLAPIPEALVNLRRLRRTLAVELAHRPGGLLAAKIHLKHVSVATTEGYAALPGGAQGKFLAEMAQEEQNRNKAISLEVFRDFQNGVMPAGPGA
ncbi:site-specific integrase [Streptomyces sp. NRRL S-646]|uniref:site-specific integrase n=1 Tax=Streptomyces sp. NRRL S-646 TaxID=1463917 RepID=UPI000B110FAB|nr:site-specific integrase [Streptomyces sp. NRRL S-646]